jgi:hypothetical protein
MADCYFSEESFLSSLAITEYVHVYRDGEKNLGQNHSAQYWNNRSHGKNHRSSKGQAKFIAQCFFEKSTTALVKKERKFQLM